MRSFLFLPFAAALALPLVQDAADPTGAAPENELADTAEDV